MFAKKEQVSGVAFYCKDCERIVDARQVGRKYVYSCNVCHTKNVAFGTEKSIRSYFHFHDPLPGAAALPGVAPAPLTGLPAGSVVAPAIVAPPSAPPAIS